MTEQINKSLTLTRVLNAPRELVFDAWTEPEKLAEWWGPEGFTNPVCEIDAQKGGAILIHMRGPDGHIYPMKGTFVEVEKPAKIVFASEAMMEENGEPLFEVLTSVTFEDENGNTKLTLHTEVTWSKPEAEPAISGMDAGWSSSLIRLAALVEGKGK